MLKHRVILIGLALFYLSACSQTDSSEEMKIVVIGDSISTGYNIAESWARRLQKTLNVTVNNHSVNGEQTAYGLEHIEPLLVQQKPSHLIIFLGTNDVYKGSAEVAIKNLDAMVAIAEKYKPQIVILTLLPASGSHKAKQNIDTINKSIRAMSNKALIIDLFKAYEESNKTSKKALLHDSVHPSNAGQELIFKTVLRKLQAPNG